MHEDYRCHFSLLLEPVWRKDVHCNAKDADLNMQFSQVITCVPQYYHCLSLTPPAKRNIPR